MSPAGPMSPDSCHSSHPCLVSLMPLLLGETCVTRQFAHPDPHTPGRKQRAHLCLEDLLLGESHVTHTPGRKQGTHLCLENLLLGESHVTHTPCRKQGTHLCLEDLLLGETHVTGQLTYDNAQWLQAATKVPHHLRRQRLHGSHVHNLKQAGENA